MSMISAQNNRKAREAECVLFSLPPVLFEYFNFARKSYGQKKIVKIDPDNTNKIFQIFFFHTRQTIKSVLNTEAKANPDNMQTLSATLNGMGFDVAFRNSHLGIQMQLSCLFFILRNWLEYLGIALSQQANASFDD